MHFITFEGCDFSGKSTQIKLLQEYLEINNKKVCVTREPGGTILAEKIRELLLLRNEISDPLIEYLLISAARKDHVDNLIKTKLKEGYYVISDRFYDSSVCYQGYYKNLNTTTLNIIKELTINKFEPDLTFLIDISVDEILKRKNIKRAENNIYDNKNQEFYQKIKASYLEIANKNPHRIFVIDGNKKAKDISKQIIKIFTKKYYS
ncbi:dTMP kinase [Candidatus Aquarickettsia rohweri]|uniref:Thymidylate kinase n=1 Tax=Candidatus Aquarickettsia rohweri TaxID=2602574 RepID=A0A3R9ZI17_9RICK|nr:dTMP kinase [Candidatus Aquarickettsia rohweri]RST67571.1 dTMP kinase [Candidatus Aquarickettsia rohweri]